jgi:glycosyltransferase involved in cell wall biosynthesis
MTKRILVPCYEMSIAGGLYRFERLRRTIQPWGYDLSFVAFSPDPFRLRRPKFDVLRPDQLYGEQPWDAVMLPGAGFPPDMLDSLDMFCHPQFGLRIQHLLNDQTPLELYRRANRAFRPDIVIANNRHWSVGEMEVFDARRAFILEGAVDTDALANVPRRKRSADGRLVVGGLANKNPQPLVQVARRLDYVDLRLFGTSGHLAESAKDLIAAGRLELVGVLDEQRLRAFYSTVDVIVHAELFAGWANVAAEAMAAGVPLICTPHGTMTFAQDGVTAQVISEPTPEALAQAIERIRRDPDMAERMAAEGRRRIRSYSWDDYSRKLLGLAFAGPF